MNSIGGVFNNGGALIPDYDMSAMLAGISDVKILDTSTNLQVGINGDNSCQINFDMNFGFDISAISAGIETEDTFNAINDFMTLLNEKSTMLGAVQNRLESALDAIEVNITNLASSRSTIRDADIAKVSSQYIQQQILQEASATLLATTKNIQYQNVLGLLQSLRG
jgi:flagellin